MEDMKVLFLVPYKHHGDLTIDPKQLIFSNTVDPCYLDID